MSEPVVVREGASLRTGDELGALFIDDALDLGAELAPWGEDVRGRVAARLEQNRSPRSGCAWLEDETLSDELGTLIGQVETELYTLGYVVTWEDGYVISRDEDGDEDGDEACPGTGRSATACTDQTHRTCPNLGECSRHALTSCPDPDCIRERGGSVLAAELRDAERWAR